jgi:hypothetical protein
MQIFFTAKIQRHKGILFQKRFFLLLGVLASWWFQFSTFAQTNDFAAVRAIFDRHCMDCHESKDPEANLVLESHETLMKGGESGAAIVPGKSAESLLVKYIEGNIEKNGKKKIMPPGKRDKLEISEIARIKAWIDAGAKPSAEAFVQELVVPKITPKAQSKKRILALAYASQQKWIAVAHYGEVELISAATQSVIRTFSGSRASVNDVTFSPDGTYIFAASGENALFGEVKQWRVSDGALIRTYSGHKDILYSLAISPDGKILATGSYDQKIKLWDTETGKEIKTLSGHNGAVFGLAFRPDGKILASASGDRTVKLWNVAQGERVDTLSQPLKEIYCVAWSADGKKLLAGGADNRLRVWEVSETAVETTNPLLESRFAHEGAILRLHFSPDGNFLLSSADDRTVKLWDAATLKERLLFEKQPDWAVGLCFAPGEKIVLGRLDGSFGIY